MKSISVPSSQSDGLSVSIVVFQPDLALLTGTLDRLRAACDTIRDHRPELPVDLYLIDNGGLPDIRAALDQLGAHDIR